MGINVYFCEEKSVTSMPHHLCHISLCFLVSINVGPTFTSTH